MKKALTPLAISLALLAGPAAAQTEPVPTPPCPTSTEYATVGLAGKQEKFSPEPIPSVGHDLAETPYNEDSVTRFKYRIDVSGSATKPFATNGTVELTLSWDNDSDFDLYAYNSAGEELAISNSFNPLDGSGELVTLPGITHCSDLRIDVVNYLGIPTSALTLDTKIKSLKP